MIKQTLSFDNPAYLSLKDRQVVIDLGADKHLRNADSIITKPLEDIGLLILNHRQITLTQGLLSALLDNNTAVITCDEKHHPVGMFLNLNGNTLQAKLFRFQTEASVPLKKQLWQQTIMAKISNQAAVLKQHRLEFLGLQKMVPDVKSGDADNHEAQAASYYWKRLFPESPDFRREREGPPPNAWLNYGYAILRACVARSLTGSGLLPTLGIHHRNQYNAYCLADDIMEPYRPYIDKLVKELVMVNGPQPELTRYIKNEMLRIPAMDVEIDGKTSPLLNAITRTTASLAKCYEGKQRKILYPTLVG